MRCCFEYPDDDSLRSSLVARRSSLTTARHSQTLWPGVTQLQDWNASFPQWPRLGTAKMVPTLDASGVDLLEKFLLYTPKDRISAKEALQHEYFDDLSKEEI